MRAKSNTGVVLGNWSAARIVTGCVLALIATRPVIDLFGHYQGGAINAGGVVGIVTTGLILVRATMRPFRIARLLTIPIVVWAYLLVSSFIMVAHQGFPELASWARLLVGFSPLLLLPALQGVSPRNRASMLTRTAIVLLLCSLVPVLIAWLQYFGFLEFSYFDYYLGQRIGRPSGGYFQPNSLGRLMVFDVVIVVMLSWKRVLSPRASAIAITAYSATALISTHRTSIVSLVAVLAILLAFEVIRRSGFRLARVALLTFSLVIVTSAIAVFTLVPGIPTADIRLVETVRVIVDSFSTVSTSSLDDGDFLRGRARIWQATVTLVAESDVSQQLFGQGYEPLEAHNDTLRVLLMHGLVGLAAYAILLGGVFVWAASKTNLQGRACIVAIYTYLILFGITLHPTGYPFFIWMFLFVLAFASSSFSRGRSHVGGHPQMPKMSE